jgi:sporulation integral membrane protein YtvI
LAEFYRENRQAIDKFILILFLSVAAYLFARFLLTYFLPFIFGYGISLLIGRPVDFLHVKLKIWRGVCVLLMLLLCVSVLSLGGTLLVGRLIREIESFASHVPEYARTLSQALDGAQYAFERVTGALPDLFGISVEDVISDLGAAAAANLGSLVTRFTLNTAAFIPRFVLIVVFSIISAFFFTKDKKIIYAALANMTPKLITDAFTQFKRRAASAVGGYIKAQLVLMTVVSSVSILGLTIIGNPYAIFIGLGIGVLDLLPVLGAGSVLVPWAAVAFIMGNVRLGISLLVLYGVCFVTRQSLESKIVGEHIGVHPILTLMAIFIGLRVFGPLGVVFGPFIAIAIKSAFAK